MYFLWLQCVPVYSFQGWNAFDECLPASNMFELALLEKFHYRACSAFPKDLEEHTGLDRDSYVTTNWN